jgi:hypothetical protein
MPAQCCPDVVGDYLIDRGPALGAARAQRGRAPSAGRLWKADPGRLAVMGCQRRGLQVIGVFQQPRPGTGAVPVQVVAAVLDGDYECS